MEGVSGIRTGKYKAYLDSIFPMVIALFDPGHLAIDLREDRRCTFLRTNDGVVVWRRRYKIAVVVSRLEPEPYDTAA